MIKRFLAELELSSRLGLLLAAFLVSAALLCAALAVGMLPVCGVAALFAAASVGFAAAMLLTVWRPLRRCEQVLGTVEQPLERRLQQLAMLPASNCAPLERALSALGADIRGQYAAALVDTQAELDALQSQINPHFLYNTLDSIRGQALYEGAADIAEMTEALSTFFRYSISNRNSVVTLEEELENVRNYFHIQQFRFNNRFRLSILPAPRADLEQCLLPKLTLQPIVENAIQHGMEGKLGGGSIIIRIEGTEHLIQVTVSDDGMGMNDETLTRMQARLSGDTVTDTPSSRGGLALPNVARRIRLLFGKNYTVQMMSTQGIGTDVVLTLPRTTNRKEEPYGA